MTNLEQLSKVMDENKAKEILDTVDKYDKYMIRFKSKINNLLKPIGLEVKSGLVFEKLNQKD